jgi:hypothetical protein
MAVFVVVNVDNDIVMKAHFYPLAMYADYRFGMSRAMISIRCRNNISLPTSGEDSNVSNNQDQLAVNLDKI